MSNRAISITNWSCKLQIVTSVKSQIILNSHLISSQIYDRENAARHIDTINKIIRPQWMKIHFVSRKWERYHETNGKCCSSKITKTSEVIDNAEIFKDCCEGVIYNNNEKVAWKYNIIVILAITLERPMGQIWRTLRTLWAHSGDISLIRWWPRGLFGYSKDR